MAYNYAAARAAGLSDEQIGQYLISKNKTMQGEVGSTPQPMLAPGMGPTQQDAANATESAMPGAKKTNPEGKKRKGNVLTDLIPLVGGIGGSAIGSLVAPGVGTIAGGGVGSAAGEALRQAIVGEDLDVGNIATEGALGVAGGVAGKVLQKGVAGAGKLLGRIAPEAAVESAASGFNIPAKLAEQVNLKPSLRTVILDGKIPSTAKGYRQLASSAIESVSPNMSKITSKIQTPINYDNSLVDINDYLIRSGVDGKDINTTMKQIRQFFKGVPSKGIGNISADDAYDVLRKLEKQGYSMKSKAFNPMTQSYDPSMEARADALIAVSQDMESQIGKFIDAEGLFPVLKGQILNTLKSNPNVGEGLYKRALAVNTYDDFRGLLAPYVNIDRAARSTINRANAPFTQAVGNVAGMGGVGIGAAAGGVPGAVAGMAAAPLVGAGMNAAKMPVGSAVSRAMLAAGNIPVPGTIATQTVGQGAAQGAQALLGGGGQEEIIPPPADMSQFSPQIQGSSLRDQAMTQGDQPMMTREQAFMLMAAYPKQASLIKSLFDIGGGNAPAKKPKTEAQVATDQARFLVDDALTQLTTNPNIKTGPIAPQLEEFKSIFNFGDPDTVGFNKAVSNLKGVIARARGGTSFTANEEKLLDKYTPNVGDSKQQLVSKLIQLQRIFASTAGTEITNPSTSTQTLIPYPSGE